MKKTVLLICLFFVVTGMNKAVCFAQEGACCMRDGSCTEEEGEAACLAIGGIYQGDYTDCLTTGCPAVQFTGVAVDREPARYQRLDPITYTVDYTVVSPTPGTTYDVKVVVLPRFGKPCKKLPPKKGIKGKAVGKDFGVVEGDHVMVIDYRPNNPEKHYVIPNCAVEDKHVTVKYVIKLFTAGTSELLATDTHLEEAQIYVEPSSGDVNCTYCH